MYYYRREENVDLSTLYYEGYVWLSPLGDLRPIHHLNLACDGTNWCVWARATPHPTKQTANGI